MSSALNEKSQIGRIPPSTYRRLCLQLLVGDAWKDLAAVIQNRKRTGLKFTAEDIEIFQRKPDPADELLRVWKTDNVTISDLIRCLIDADLLRQAAYISQLITPDETRLVEIPIAAIECSHATSQPVSQTETCDVTSNEGLPIDRGCDGASGEGVPIAKVSFDVISSWTHGFDSRSCKDGGRLLGKGGYADVFKGADGSGKLVAVKKFKDSSTSCRRQFENEINIQLKCRHENVVSLTGFCDDVKGCCLIYEYMCNGSLEEFLENRDTRPVLSVLQRLKIAQDVVHGIAYLNEMNFIHRDIKSANILLNDKLRAKLGDFGITRSGPSAPLNTSTETMVLIGTTPYMAPEYLLNGKLSFKTDSFSFGVVLLELLTGLPAYDTRREEHTLLEHIRENFGEENYYEMVDKRVENWDRSIVKQIYDMAVRLCGKEKIRPTVSSVLNDIVAWTDGHNESQP